MTAVTAVTAVTSRVVEKSLQSWYRQRLANPVELALRVAGWLPHPGWGLGLRSVSFGQGVSFGQKGAAWLSTS